VPEPNKNGTAPSEDEKREGSIEDRTKQEVVHTTEAVTGTTEEVSNEGQYTAAQTLDTGSVQLKAETDGIEKQVEETDLDRPQLEQPQAPVAPPQHAAKGGLEGVDAILPAATDDVAPSRSHLNSTC